MRIKEKYINGHLFDMSIYDGLIDNLKDYTNNEKSSKDIEGVYKYKGVQIACISGDKIIIENMFTYGFSIHLWDNTETEENKQYCFNSFIESLEGKR